MGSEGPAAVTIHVTGFKKFHGVSENPTETIVNNLKEYLKMNGLPKGLTLGSCSILETAGEGSLAPLYQTLQSAISEKDSQSSNSGQIIWVSFFYVKSIFSFSVYLTTYSFSSSYLSLATFF